MTHYLKVNGSNETIFEAKVTKIDLFCLIHIRTYSSFLIEKYQDGEDYKEVVDTFDYLQNLRKLYFESKEIKEKPIDDFVEKTLKCVAKYYGFEYVTD